MKPEDKMKQLDSTTTDNNVMPSMVVRQQRIQMGTSANQLGCNRRPIIGGGQPNDEPKTTLMAPPPQPPPTLSLIKAAKEMNGSSGADRQQQFDQDGLVLPKRVLHHPVSMAQQPIIRDLNRELKFNQIRGKNVLDQKSELKKALEKLQDSKRRKEAEQERLSRRSSLELRLEERAEKIAKQSGPQTKLATDQSAESSSAHQAPTATCKPLSNFTIRSITR